MSRRGALHAIVALLLAGCTSEAAAPAASSSAPLSSPVVFEFGTTVGESFSSATTRGRVTAILFVTTFDLASQLMARRLNDTIRRHAPRANAGAVILEAPNHGPLADVFRESLELVYPVAMADTEGMLVEGPFGVVDRVPTLVVLDRSGRQRFRRSGVLSSQELDRALRSAEP